MGWLNQRMHVLAESFASTTSGATKTAMSLWETSQYRPALIKWASPDWLTLWIGVAATSWLLLRPHPPGYAMGVLAIVAALSTFLSKPTAQQRVLIILLAVTLFWSEMSAIESDRDRSRAEILTSLVQAMSHRDSAKPVTDSAVKTQSNLDRDGTKARPHSWNDWNRSAAEKVHLPGAASPVNEAHSPRSDGEDTGADNEGENIGAGRSGEHLQDGLYLNPMGDPSDGDQGTNNPTDSPGGGFPNSQFPNLIGPPSQTPHGLSGPGINMELPEPATWADMIINLTVGGVILRRRKLLYLRADNAGATERAE